MRAMTFMPNKFIFRIFPAQPTREFLGGFAMRRAIPMNGVESVGPFILLFHVGPRQFRPGDPAGLQPLPHAGIEALTVSFEGGGMYRDSLGNVRGSRPGEARWMRAGRGIIMAQGVDEVMQRHGGPLHAVQLWINMPQGRKQEAPAYRHIAADEVPSIVYDKGLVDMHLVAGRLAGRQGPISTYGEPFVAHVEMRQGARTDIVVPHDNEVAVYGLRGRALVGTLGEPLNEGEIAVSALDGGRISIATERGAHVLVFGGPPLDAPIVRHGPFVMNTAEELARVCEDYRSGRMGELAAVV
jgi:quercetin 2,3-dioxygenase